MHADVAVPSLRCEYAGACLRRMYAVAGSSQNMLTPMLVINADIYAMRALVVRGEMPICEGLDHGHSKI